MEGWVQSLTAVASNGNLEQVYPDWAPAGVDPATATNGQQIRQPIEGVLYNLQIATDGTNAGTLEIWDLNGLDVGADVSSSNVVTDAQRAALVTLGKAKLIYVQNFAALPATPINISPRAFQHGLAARFYNAGATGTCTISLSVQGGFRLVDKLG